jgi:hypothetical protein
MQAPKRTIAVHVLGDERTHLAPPHLGRLAQGRLKTLCGKLAVGELSPFQLLKAEQRCPDCFAEARKIGALEADAEEKPKKKRR